MSDTRCDILIVGGGVGGVAAALAASQHDVKVILSDEFAWVGGQLTSQGVPPDEYPWIEGIAPTALYKEFRDRVRRHYEQHSRLDKSVVGTAFNPGLGFVSGLCHEPRIAHSVLTEMLSKPVVAGRLIIKNDLQVVSAEFSGRTIRSVTFRHKLMGDLETISAKMFIDCTELGDLLPLTGTDYVSGAEAASDTGELHGVDVADPEDVQGFTWCLALANDPDGHHIVERPASYDFWRTYVPDLTPDWPGRLFSWTAVSPITLEPRTFDLFAQPDQPYNNLWNYRKIRSKDFLLGRVDDITLVNWPQNDYFLTNIIDKDSATVARALEESRELSLSLLYWMQTEAPRRDGGNGYPGLYPAPDVLGTDDGLAMAPYIRESRRIRAVATVTEAHVGLEMRKLSGFDRAEEFPDSVGIGCYRIDLHPTPAGKNYVDISSLPFQIPLGALIPQDMINLAAGCKNIGVTHITNGCYRLHPVEWSVGEAAGHLTAFCLKKKVHPHDVHQSADLLVEFQSLLSNSGIRLTWPDAIAHTPR